MYVIKRDGTRVLFDINKIVNAINKAMIHVDGGLFETETAEEIADIIAHEGKDMTVEHIQDRVEQELMKSSRPDVAKAYILYRDQRTKERDRNSRLIRTVMRRNDATAVENANANVDENSFSGREKEASSDIQKIIALDYTLSPEVANAHKTMLLYQHDLEKTNIGMHNCLFTDFKQLFTNGFKTRNGDIRPPSSFSTACQQVAVIFQCQSQVQFGGVGTVHLDYDLAPFVKKSFYKHIKNYFIDVLDLTEEGTLRDLNEFEAKWGEICIDNTNLQRQYPVAYKYAMKQLEREGKQSAEALFHNLNTLESRAGSQVPFTSINFGRDTSTEGKLVQKWMLNASIAGVGKHHLTPIFPISIFQYKSGVNAEPGTPGYALKQHAIESLSKRIYPNFVNCDYSQANEDLSNPDTFFATMGKRKLQPM